jgi:protein-tyrosine phosphatase
LKPRLYWVEIGGAGRVAIMARPRAGDWLEDELVAVRDAGVAILVSLLTDEEIGELGLEAEPRACARAGMRFRRFPITDREVPSQQAATFVGELAAEVRAGETIAIHCRMGIGRSAVIAAAVLSSLGVPPEEALDRLATARGVPVPDTDDQRRWVLAFESALPTRA